MVTDQTLIILDILNVIKSFNIHNKYNNYNQYKCRNKIYTNTLLKYHNSNIYLPLNKNLTTS